MEEVVFVLENNHQRKHEEVCVYRITVGITVIMKAEVTPCLSIEVKSFSDSL